MMAVPRAGCFTRGGFSLILFISLVIVLTRPPSSCQAYPTPVALSLRINPARPAARASTPLQPAPSTTLRNRHYFSRTSLAYPPNHWSISSKLQLQSSSIDVNLPSENKEDHDNNQHKNTHTNNKINNEQSTSLESFNFLQWKDILPISLYATICLIGAALVSSYEDYDVTHIRPNPSTIRRPTSVSREMFSSSGSTNANFDGNFFNFIGAATKGMGWGPLDRGAFITNINARDDGSNNQERERVPNDNDNFFEDWYGTSATTLQSIPSYNEIMLQHRMQRVPRWNSLDGGEKPSMQFGNKSPLSPQGRVPSKEGLKAAVLQLYQSLDELDNLKQLADEYLWDDIKEHLYAASVTASLNGESVADSTDVTSLRTALEYSMDTLKAAPLYYSNNSNNSQDKRIMENAQGLQTTIGFDWGSCAWRHCGAKADAQEALAELYSSVGMLEPFECRFIIDIIERSIRDVLAAVPTDLLPDQNGVVLQVKPYEPYVSQGDDDDEGMGLDTEYAKALSDLRIDMSLDD